MEQDRHETPPGAPVWSEAGGLRFEVSFRGRGPTLRVEGRGGEGWTELLRFDDFVDQPHFHAPASGDPIPFERAGNGEPLAWFVAQVRDHLGEWLERAGYGEIAGTVDFAAVSRHAGSLDEEMRSCVPAGFVRVPGVGLTRA